MQIWRGERDAPPARECPAVDGKDLGSSCSFLGVFRGRTMDFVLKYIYIYIYNFI